MTKSYYIKNTNNNSSEENTGVYIVIQFWTLLFLSILAILCSLLVLWVLLHNKASRRSLHYRVIIIQLCAGLVFLLTHVPIYLSFLALGYVWPKTPAICQFWWLVGEGYSDAMTILMAWASIERHILIFHDRWSATRKKRFLIHYLPLVGILIYYFIYYSVASAFPPCKTEYNYAEKFCGLSCLYQNSVLVIYDTITNDIFATLVIAASSIALIFRITCQTTVHNGARNRWKRHRKLIIILLTVAVVYLVFDFPIMLVVLAELCGLSEELTNPVKPYLELFDYFVYISYPFICLGIITDKVLNRRRRRLVGITNIPLRPR